MCAGVAWEESGPEEALQAIKDAISFRCCMSIFSKNFSYATPKGFLLYGPPGCGKTLIRQGDRYNLTKQLATKPARNMKEYFMHVQGPENLNIGLRIRTHGSRIFATAREKRRDGFHARFCLSTGGIDSWDGAALLGHSIFFHARADVLLGDGRHRFVDDVLTSCVQSRPT